MTLREVEYHISLIESKLEDYDYVVDDRRLALERELDRLLSLRDQFASPPPPLDAGGN